MTADSQINQWKPCPQGTLSGLSDGLKRQRRREELTRVAGVLSVLLLAVTAGWYAVRSAADPQELHFGGIACSQVQEALPKYLSGDLDPAIVDQIDTHLTACPHCQMKVRQMRPAQARFDARDLQPTVLASADF